MNNVHTISELEEAVIGLNLTLAELLIDSMEKGRRENEHPWVVFTLGGTEYAINCKHILSIAVLKEIIPVKNAPSYCPGITSYRSEMIYLLDLYAQFGNTESIVNKNEASMIIITEIDGIKRGIITDEIISMEFFERYSTEEMKDDSVRSWYIRETAQSVPRGSKVYLVRPENLRMQKC